jgi:hypothetical protein
VVDDEVGTALNLLHVDDFEPDLFVGLCSHPSVPSLIGTLNVKAPNNHQTLKLLEHLELHDQLDSADTQIVLLVDNSVCSTNFGSPLKDTVASTSAHKVICTSQDFMTIVAFLGRSDLERMVNLYLFIAVDSETESSPTSPCADLSASFCVNPVSETKLMASLSS